MKRAISIADIASDFERQKPQTVEIQLGFSQITKLFFDGKLYWSGDNMYSNGKYCLNESVYTELVLWFSRKGTLQKEEGKKSIITF